jgi:hypothetical protein
MNDSRPMRQLIFAAISAEYIVLYFWHADWPVDVRYMSVIRMAGVKTKEIFYCTLDGPAKTLGDIRQLLRRGEISVLGVQTASNKVIQPTRWPAYDSTLND